MNMVSSGSPVSDHWNKSGRTRHQARETPVSDERITRRIGTVESSQVMENLCRREPIQVEAVLRQIRDEHGPKLFTLRPLPLIKTFHGQVLIVQSNGPIVTDMTVERSG